jgi:peptide/nickel transport system permease protein
VQQTIAWETLRPAPPPALPVRVGKGLIKFCRKKPLGALGGAIVLLLLFAAVFGPFVAPYRYDEYQLGRRTRLQPPSAEHLMGTDQLGRDVFSRLLYGARISVFIGLGVVLISTVLSTTISVVSGYYVTSIDLVLQRVLEIWIAMPDLIILIALMGIYGANPLTLVLTVGILRGLGGSRLLRGMVIQLRGAPYVEAARACGASDTRILVHHILPNIFFLIVVGATAGVAGAIAAEAGLAVLGFGISPTYPTWGVMIQASREFLRTAPWMAIFPVMALSLVIYGFGLLGDALRDVVDPRLRGGRGA